MPAATQSLEQLSINAIRTLAIDAVQAANSGHPGLPMGAAPMAYALWTRHLQHNPKNPKWFNRDRFILSAGHGSMLIYSLLYLTGYDLPLSEIKNFRQLHSKTPGHPENFATHGVEMATGPLGQGIAQSVGFAIAEKWLAATFNKPQHQIIDHFTYVIVSDGDLMEGVSSEAGAIAGHLGLGKLIVLYDDNDVTLDGPASLSFSENIELRFRSFNWDVRRVDGMDVEAVDSALREARNETEKPTLIMAKTIIGYGSPNRAGTSEAHGKALGADEVKATKERLGIPLEPAFYVDDAALNHFREALSKGEEAEQKWHESFKAYEFAYPEDARALRNAISGEYGKEWLDKLPSFTTEEKQATRQASSKVINAIAPYVPNLIGGSADLSESTLTTQKQSGNFTKENPGGRNIFFGVREHAMIAAVNGITLHGGARGYGGSFFCFTDYCRPAIRLAALMETPSIYVFTHDSVGLGEDGPTHQPVEHLTAMRAIPNLNVFRPADGNETTVGWKIAVQSEKTPTLLVLTRQALPTLTPADVKKHPAEKGAYVLQEGSSKPEVILIGTGSEVSVCVKAKELLEADGITTRVVSMPSWLLFERQSVEYRQSVLPTGVRTVSVEAGSTMAWPRYAELQVGIDRFGLSAPGDQVLKEFGITPEHVAEVAKSR
ncbi:MAG: transketolase [Fimbriimonas sp.]